MTSDNNEYDASLGERLSEALRAEAGSVPVAPDAWARFQERERSEGSVISDAIPLEAQPVPFTRSPSERRHPWRIPLIAAASVVAIAVATTAIATGGFRGGQETAAPGAAVDPSTPVAVPIDYSYGTSGPAGAVATDPNGDRSAALASTRSDTEPVSVWMSFAGGAPPSAALSSQVELADGRKSPAEESDPDGTPLGYVTRISSFFGDAPGATPGATSWTSTTVWGAVGPNVAQVQVDSELQRSGSAQARWTIGPKSEAASVWTPLQTAGWNGFAVQLPKNATWVTVTAFDGEGRAIQARRIDLGTGKETDLTVPPATGQPSPSHITGTDLASRAHDTVTLP
ncbi:MAG TPA: hypothetical protein VF277_01895, partial [Steroidobacteraceae bacterium]